MRRKLARIGTSGGSIIATIITSHIATKRTPLPAQVSPGIGIQTIDIVQPPGIAIPPAMVRDQWIVPAALIMKSSALTARKGPPLGRATVGPVSLTIPAPPPAADPWR